MSISNVELRRKVFGAGRHDHAVPAKKAQAKPERPILPRAQTRLAALAMSVMPEAKPRAQKKPLPARLLENARARAWVEPPGRLGFADTGKGIAIVLVMLAAIIRTVGVMPAGFGWLGSISSFLYPFAMPAFLVFAGMFMRRSREDSWDVYLTRKIGPLAAALAIWIVAVATVSILQLDGRALQKWPGLFAAIGPYAGLATVLFVLPAFLLVWKLLSSFRTGAIFVLAAIVEILHTEQGGVLWVEAMRGMVYFAAGHCLAPNLRVLARFARDNKGLAFAVVLAWVALNGIMVLADLPMAYGEQIATLPFASLGLGLAGAAAMVLLGELVSSTRFGAFFAQIGRNWIAYYAAIPLGFVVLGAFMTMAGMFGSPAQAIAAILSAALAAGGAHIVLALREPAAEERASAIQNL